LSVTKKDLAKQISFKVGLLKKDSYFIVESFFQFISANNQKSINVSKFGTFTSKETPKRIGRNPKSLQEFEIKARKKLNFKSSEEVKKSIN
jgi:integration host factor subunit alpha